MSRTQKIIYKNTSGQSLIISHIAPFVYKSKSGFGMVDNVIKSTPVFGKAGEQLNYESQGNRSMEVQFRIIANSFDDLHNLKRYVMSILKPQSSGTLSYMTGNDSYEIDVKIVKGIDEKDENSAIAQLAIVQFEALNIYWRNTSNYSQTVQLAQKINLHKFPLQFDSDYKFSELKTGNIALISNSGDIPVGFEMVLKFNGPVTNPKLLNIYTNEVMQLNYAFSANDELIVNTNQGNKQIMLNGQNAFYLKTQVSTFFQIAIGDNNLQLLADSGSENMIGTLSYIPLVNGV